MNIGIQTIIDKPICEFACAIWYEPNVNIIPAINCAEELNLFGVFSRNNNNVNKYK